MHPKKTDVDAYNIPTSPPINWRNVYIVFGIHFGAFFGVVYVVPWSMVQTKTLILTFFLWVCSWFGIAIGYHRLWCHRAFSASLGTRIVLAIFGTLAIQESIQWWTVRHRLHHRFTDDPVNDPYAVTRGIYFSHIGWIFFDPKYPKLESVDKSDLKRDPIVEFQDKYYLLLAMIIGLVVPTLIGRFWGDTIGALVWGGFVHKIIIWHMTFALNSIGHRKGSQKYSDEMSAKTNPLLAAITFGEGNHNFHAFPFDYRASPGKFEYDPSKWIIFLLAQIGFITSLKRADDEDIEYAMKYMSTKHKAGRSAEPLPLHEGQLEAVPWTGPVFGYEEAEQYIRASPSVTKCFVVIYDYLVDVTKFMKDHPGGAAIFRPYSVRVKEGEIIWQDATWAFKTHNRHTMNACRRVRQLAVAKIFEKEK